MKETGLQEDKRSSLFPPGEDTSPCSVTAIMKRIARDKSKHLRKFLEDLGYYSSVWPVPAMHMPIGVELYNELKGERRALAWCPPNINILDHVNPFLISRAHSRGVDVAPSQTSAVAQLVSRCISKSLPDSSWLISWNLENEERNHKQSSSGFYRTEHSFPAQHLAYMVAWAVYHRTPVPFASPDRKHLRFVRTGTKAIDRPLYLAYVPDDAIYFKITDELPEDAAPATGLIPIVLTSP